MRTTVFGKETKIWPLLPDELRSASSLQTFKNNAKKWKQIVHVGFVSYSLNTSFIS